MAEAAGGAAEPEFLSTPSARRATSQRQRRGCRNTISIHALREEGDAETLTAAQAEIDISIHALREEGDLADGIKVVIGHIFLSTPSARRATADRQLGGRACR